MSEAVLGIRVQLLNLKMALLSNASIYSALTGTKYEVSYILYIHFFSSDLSHVVALRRLIFYCPFKLYSPNA